MKIQSWNCLGLGNPRTVNTLRQWCWRDRPDVVFLMETKIDASRVEKIRNKCGFVAGICLSSVGNSGGMALWWRDINVVVSSFSSHHIEAEVRDQSNVMVWKLGGVYGWPEAANKHLTWELMKRLWGGCSTPLVLCGDFNEITGPSEKEGGVVRGECQMDAFREAIDCCVLRDMGFRGNMFTWQRGNTPATFVRERLDRFLANEGWCNLFPNAAVVHLPIYCSDHAPLLLKTENVASTQKSRMFRFESLWLSKEECAEVVNNSWRCNYGESVTMKLSHVSNSLSEWAAHSFGDVKKKIKTAEKKLKLLQELSPDSHMLEQCHEISMELDELHRMEESYWCARARTNELRDGDKNTSYFHSKATKERREIISMGLWMEMVHGNQKEKILRLLWLSILSTFLLLKIPVDMRRLWLVSKVL